MRVIRLSLARNMHIYNQEPTPANILSTKDWIHKYSNTGRWNVLRCEVMLCGDRKNDNSSKYLIYFAAKYKYNIANLTITMPSHL